MPRTTSKHIARKRKHPETREAMKAFRKFWAAPMTRRLREALINDLPFARQLHTILSPKPDAVELATAAEAKRLWAAVPPAHRVELNKTCSPARSSLTRRNQRRKSRADQKENHNCGW
jgi:hypothetical protein